MSDGQTDNHTDTNASFDTKSYHVVIKEVSLFFCLSIDRKKGTTRADEEEEVNTICNCVALQRPDGRTNKEGKQGEERATEESEESEGEKGISTDEGKSTGRAYREREVFQRGNFRDGRSLWGEYRRRVERVKRMRR